MASEERLLSRFQWGLSADIQPPDFETRLAIVKKLADDEGVGFPGDVEEFLAHSLKGSIRKLEGSLIRLLAYANLHKREIDLEMTEMVLADVIRAEQKIEEAVVSNGDSDRKPIKRTIEFSPEYSQAGITILSYFAKIVRNKYPETPVTVRIEQTENEVTLVVDTPKGEAERIERTLEEYGRVVIGDLAVEDFLENKVEAIELKTQLRAAYLQLESARDIIQLKSEHQDDLKDRIVSLERSNSDLKQMIGGLLMPARDHQASMIEALNELIKGQKKMVVSALKTISDGLESKQVRTEKVQHALETLHAKEPGILDNVKVFASKAATGTVGQILYDLISMLPNSGLFLSV